MKTALLLSGGMDSIAIAWWKRPDIALTLDYGQQAANAEIKAATATCEALGIEHHIIRIDCRSLIRGYGWYRYGSECTIERLVAVS